MFFKFGWPKQKITVIPHFIEKSKEEPDFNPGDYLLYFGRLSPEKGLDKLIEAIYNTGLKINLKIAGHGPEKKRLQGLTTKLGIGSQVQFLGQLSGEKLQKVIKDCLLVVMPTQANETFGLSALEAFNCGKTVLASNKGALPEIVINNKTGIIFQNNLAAALKEAVKDKNKIKQLAINAYQSVDEKYSPQSHYEKILSLYNSIIHHYSV
jgi:glycosyltransferase involved in cell wall biosynthesis